MRVVGMRAYGGPLYQTAVTFEPGLNVLYGKNGAGKSSLLEFLVAGLTGVRPAKEPGLVWVILEGIPSNSYQEDSFDLGNSNRTNHFYSDSVAAEDLVEDVRNAILFAQEEMPWTLDERAADEAVTSRIVAVRPVGRSDPRWLVELCAPVSPTFENAFRTEMAMTVVADDLDDEELSELEHRVRTYGLFLHGYRSIDNIDLIDTFDIVCHPQIPLSIAEIGETQWLGQHLPRLIRESANPEQDAARVTRESAAAAVEHWQYYDAGDVDGLAVVDLLRDKEHGNLGAGFWLPPLTEWAERLEAETNQIYSQLLLDAPHLALTRGSLERWLIGEPLSWGVGRWHERSLSTLSRAELRWASVAIQIAALDLEGSAVLVLDEPEAALHRTAEAHMAAGLAELAASRDLQIVVASHSPALLDHPEATVTRVASTPHRWKGPTSEAVTMTAPRRSELEELGLQPSDLLASRRVILLVEGHHDELVIRGILGQELERLRVDVLPVNKGSNLRAAIDSRLLFDYTDATVIAIVDNLNGDRVLGVWDRALVIATTDGPERAGEFIRRELPASQAPENGFIAQFMSRAITAGLESRVVPFAFSAPDIQEYLPTRGFLPGRASWADLRAEWTSSGTALAFKPWLQQHKGAQFDDAAFSKALDMLEAVPPEFTHLLKVIEARTANRAAVDPLPYST